jgi:hydrogenase maturation protein HypF
MTSKSRLSVRVEGVVQGVGFRPFVRNLATRLGLSGFVGNDVSGVFIEVEGDGDQLSAFLAGLEDQAPPLSMIERVTTRPLRVTEMAGFEIVASDGAGERQALVSADTATCRECLQELFDAANRRYRYPFINCTNCGPRFTIVRDVPYDRQNTTMASFAMCGDCQREYDDPADRRYHAQPTCCPRCGPALSLTGPGGDVVAVGDPALAGTIQCLRSQEVVAIKGLGGYHLAVVASSEKAAACLRARKHREDKPFAVMVKDLATARSLCEVGVAEEELLTSPAHPIVLARRQTEGLKSTAVAPSVAPGNRYLGVMLPYTPLHHLIAAGVGEPFVLTSGNVSDEPIAYEDEDARERLGGIADAFLVHDRAVHMRTDDSVTRSLAGRSVVVRRSRGYVPRPLSVPCEFPRPVLACGAELKNTFCLAKGNRSFVSHHIGDLENFETLRSFRDGIEHFCRLFDVNPEIVAHDLHPEYLSTKYALERQGVDLVGVQHHHAHVVSCLADSGETGPVIGVAFDGLGYGDDGTLWGGEILIADLAHYQRVGHLVPVPMPGGRAAIKQPWRMAASYLDLAFPGSPPASLSIVRRHEDQWGVVVALARSGVASPMTSSAGRLFDAVAAIVCGRDAINYEGQAAIELEQLADTAETSAYPAPTECTGTFQIVGAELVRCVAEDMVTGVAAPVVAARFHNAVAASIVAACVHTRGLRSNLATVALSGGVFQNVLLTERVVTGLERAGFRVLLHRRVPTNDGGISFGQAVVAGARTVGSGVPGPRASNGGDNRH